MSETATVSNVTRLDEYVRKVVDSAPPLSQAQRERLQVLLTRRAREPRPHFEVSQPLDVRIEP